MHRSRPRSPGSSIRPSKPNYRAALYRTNSNAASGRRCCLCAESIAPAASRKLSLASASVNARLRPRASPPSTGTLHVVSSGHSRCPCFARRLRQPIHQAAGRHAGQGGNSGNHRRAFQCAELRLLQAQAGQHAGLRAHRHADPPRPRGVSQHVSVRQRRHHPGQRAGRLSGPGQTDRLRPGAGDLPRDGRDRLRRRHRRQPRVQLRPGLSLAGHRHADERRRRPHRSLRRPALSAGAGQRRQRARRPADLQTVDGGNENHRSDHSRRSRRSACR